MGYGSTTFKVLAELRRKGTLASVRSVMDIGAQEAFLFGQHDDVSDFLRAFGAESLAPDEVAALVERRFVKHLWERLGIEYSSIDYDAQFETLLLDLNYDLVPDAFLNRFDLTTNCGTTEHVLNQMNSFRVMHDLTRRGGYMLHDVPWAGLFNHGLINYKPHLFWRLCQSNYYNWTGMWLRAETAERATLPDNIVASCSDNDQDFYRRFAAHDGMMTVVLQKAYDIPFVCPLDMEGTRILPGESARRRYWTLAEPDGVDRIETYRAEGFPNAEDPRILELKERCQQLEGTIAFMESSRFWKLRNVMSRWKKSFLSRMALR